MGASAQVIPSGDQIMANVAALRSQGAPEADIEAYLQQSGLSPDPTGIHAEYASGRLAKRMARENTNDREAAAVPETGYAGRVATHVLNAAQGIPGMQAVEAFMGSLGSRATGHPLSYRESLNTLNDQTSNIGGVASVGEKMLGSAPLLPFLPASPAMAGGLLGGADQALNANPDQSLAERGLRTAAGAGVGAITGKLLDKLVTAGKANLPAKLGGVPSSAQNVIDREAARGTAAASSYGAALAEGAANGTDTPAIRAALAQPDIQSVGEGLLQTRRFAGRQMNDPDVLDAIYKTLSDQAAAAKKGLDALTPNKANIGRFRLAEIKDAQQTLLEAMTKPSVRPPLTFDVPAGVHDVAPSITAGHEAMAGPIAQGPLADMTTAPNPSLSQALRNFQGATPNAVQGPAGPSFMLRGQPGSVTPGVQIETPAMRVQTAPASVADAPMPTYGKAVGDYAQSSKLIKAVQRGSDMIHRAGTALQSGKNLDRTSTEAFVAWAKTATPAERQAAQEGILGALKQVDQIKFAKLLGIPILPHPTSAMSQAPGLLRVVNPAAGNLATAGLLSLHSLTSP